MSLNLYKYHTNPETITGFDQAMDSVPSVAWEHYKGNHEELRKREHMWAKSAEHSYWYALFVLKGERFIKGEDAIATDALYSYRYANNVLKGERVEKFEDAIATSARHSYEYAFFSLNGERFIKGEDAIRGSEYQQAYEQEFGIKL